MLLTTLDISFSANTESRTLIKHGKMDRSLSTIPVINTDAVRSHLMMLPFLALDAGPRDTEKWELVGPFDGL